MQTEKLKYLFERYFQKQASPEERGEFFELAQRQENEIAIQALMAGHWDNFDTEKEPFSAKDRDLILDNILSTTTKATPLWTTLRIAAAIAAISIVSVLWLYRVQQKNTYTDLIASTKGIMPAKNGATLTLANGKKIMLTEVGNGELAKEAGVKIVKSADGELIYEVLEAPSNDETSGQLNVLSTANGQTYQVRLPDGSKVWLNAASSIKYPSSFKNLKVRSVKLEGEAYFEIAKDKIHPFLVESKHQQIKVLGTHFNVNSYENESSASTTLLEGSIQLTTDKSSHLLIPGQQAVYAKNSVRIEQANLQSIMDWRNDEFYLDHINFKVALRKLERWYNIKFIYDESIPDDMVAGGWISRTSPLSNVLSLIGKSGQVNFKVKGSKIYVTM